MSGVGAEVDVDLEGEEQHAPPGVGEAEPRRVGGEGRVRPGRQRVGQGRFLDDAQHEAGEPFRQVARPPVPARQQLRLKLVVLDDRPGQQLREQEHVEQVGRQVGRRAAEAAPDVDQVGDLLEHDERDADGQRHRAHPQRRQPHPGQHQVHVVDREARVLVIAQHADVDQHAQSQPPSAAGPRDHPPQHQVRDAGRQHHRHEQRLAPEIEENAGREQHPGPCPMPAPHRQEHGEHDGEEQEQEQRLIEQHAG